MKVAKSLFVTGPDDDLATVDAYHEKVASYETPDAKEKEGKPPTKSEIKDERELEREKTRELAEASSSSGDAGSAPMDELAKMTGESSNPMAGLTDEEKAVVEKALKEAGQEDGYVLANNKLDTSTVITPVGEYEIDEAGNVKTKAGLKIFANIMGDSFICGFLEESGQILQAGKALFDLSLDIDIVECISELVKTAKSEKLRKELIRQAGANYARKGQLHGLADIVESVGPEGVESDEVDIVPTVLVNYKRPKTIKDTNEPTGKRPVVPDDDPALFNQMDETLSEFDPNWGYYYRDDEWIPDARIHSKLSPEAMEVMSTNRERKAAIAVAQEYYPGGRSKHAKSSYPYAVIDATA